MMLPPGTLGASASVGGVQRQLIRLGKAITITGTIDNPTQLALIEVIRDYSPSKMPAATLAAYLSVAAAASTGDVGRLKSDLLPAFAAAVDKDAAVLADVLSQFAPATRDLRDDPASVPAPLPIVVAPHPSVPWYSTGLGFTLVAAGIVGAAALAIYAATRHESKPELHVEDVHGEEAA